MRRVEQCLTDSPYCPRECFSRLMPGAEWLRLANSLRARHSAQPLRFCPLASAAALKRAAAAATAGGPCALPRSDAEGSRQYTENLALVRATSEDDAVLVAVKLW